jgi:hypothetical protein
MISRARASPTWVIRCNSFEEDVLMFTQSGVGEGVVVEKSVGIGIECSIDVGVGARDDAGVV